LPISEQARTIRTAISPRLAINIFLNTLSCLNLTRIQTNYIMAKAVAKGVENKTFEILNLIS
jgi:hypothetical protein